MEYFFLGLRRLTRDDDEEKLDFGSVYRVGTWVWSVVELRELASSSNTTLRGLHRHLGVRTARTDSLLADVPASCKV